jgi:hypothetical protein
LPAATKFGRIHVPEPLETLTLRHTAGPGTPAVRSVAHPPSLPVLDQEDLHRQGIDTADIVPGAPDVDALGSCVANASTAALSAGDTLAGINARLAPGAPQLTGDPAGAERFAIWLYHCLTSSMTHTSAWPPTDGGSSGLAACRWLEHQGLIRSHRIAHGAENILSLMQTGPLIVGQPWFNSWMEPTAGGFIDGDGTPAALDAAISSGVAGGHETCWYGVEQVAFDLAGGIDPAKTVIRFRNSWSAAWGDQGDGLAHLSTFMGLAGYCDYRQFRF